MLTVLGAVFPYFWTHKREIWHAGDAPRAKFHGYQSNVSPLRGEKPIFGPLSKNNTGEAQASGNKITKLQTQVIEAVHRLLTLGWGN